MPTDQPQQPERLIPLPDNFIGAFDLQSRFHCESCITEDEMPVIQRDMVRREGWTILLSSDAWGFEPCAVCGDYPERR